MHNKLVTAHDSTSVTSELFKTLRTNIEFGTSETQNVIMITSSEPGDGKSFVSSNLSVSFAQMGKKVLLIDLDLRKGQQHKIFGIKNIKGMANLLNLRIDDEEILIEKLVKTIQTTKVPGLSIITSGAILHNPSELLMNGRLAIFLEYFRDKYDYIFVDVPPLNIVTDPAIIARYVDSTVLVVSVDKTHSKALKESVQILEKANIDIIGVVANNVEMNHRDYKYKKYQYSETRKINSKNKKKLKRKK